MKPRRFPGTERGDSALLVAALLGVLLGSSASLWAQRGTGSHVCTPAGCPTCPVCAAVDAAAGSAAALQAATLPVGGTFRPAGRESAGNAELASVLKRVAINDEVLVAGTWRALAARCAHSL
jgi:hypothetical protein